MCKGILLQNQNFLFLHTYLHSGWPKVREKGDSLCQQWLLKQSNPLEREMGNLLTQFNLLGCHCDFSNNLTTSSKTIPFLSMTAKFL
jgi:hypothetical protein